jgi:hypothetical protein
MRPASFVPTIAAISAGEAHKVPGLEAVISHWTEGRRSPEEWFRELGACWGTAGFGVHRGDDVLGFVVYAPGEHLPRAGTYPVGPLDENGVLLAYAGGDARTRRRLLVRMLRDLRHRGVGRVEAIASFKGASTTPLRSFAGHPKYCATHSALRYARAAMVKNGLVPSAHGMIAPSMTYSP